MYLLLALLLAGRVYFLRSKKDWSQRRVFVSEEAWPSIFGSLFAGAAIAILAGLDHTHLLLRGFDRRPRHGMTFSRPIRDRLSNAVSALNGPYGRPGTNFYGSSLLVGQSAASGDLPVFTVDVSSGLVSTPRFYWRGRVYDSYTDWALVHFTGFKPRLSSPSGET